MQLKNKSVRIKMILIFTPLILVTTLLMAFLAYWLFSMRMEAILTDNMTETVHQVNRHVDTYMEEFVRLTALPYYSAVVSVMESRLPLTQDQYDTVQNVISGAVINQRDDLKGVFLFRRDGELFSATMYNAYINYNYDHKQASWYVKAVSREGEVVFIPPNDEPNILNHMRPTFSVARAIKRFNGPILATIVIDVEFDGLKELFDNVDLGEQSNLVVLDEENKVIYSKNDNYIGVLDHVEGVEDQLHEVAIDQEDIIVSTLTSSVTGWKMVGMQSKTELFDTIRLTRNLLLIISITLTVIVALICIWIAYSITQPLRHLKKYMQEVEKGNYNVSFQMVGMNEVSDVGRAFNRMTREINNLVNQVLKVGYRQKEAEMQYLKLQIRPHFLYNNLEAIRALAELEDKKGIIDITRSLGEMLRYSLHKQNSLVELSEELTQVRHYLNIEQIRSGHALETRFDIEHGIEDSLIAPMVLQPIVENCIQHGFRSRSIDKIIRIRAWRERATIVIEIRDNGAGIEPHNLEALEAMLQQPDSLERSEARFGIGLKNVHTRLVLTFGFDSGLRLESRQGQGTTVRVVIPQTHAVGSLELAGGKEDESDEDADRR